jgi:hypothetical protein
MAGTSRLQSPCHVGYRGDRPGLYRLRQVSEARLDSCPAGGRYRLRCRWVRSSTATRGAYAAVAMSDSTGRGDTGSRDVFQGAAEVLCAPIDVVWGVGDGDWHRDATDATGQEDVLLVLIDAVT